MNWTTYNFVMDSERFRRFAAVLLQVGLAFVANYAAFWLRFDGDIPSAYLVVWASALSWVLLARVSAFVLFRLFEGLWRYTSIWDLRNIIAAVVLSSGVYFVAVTFVVGLTYPRSVPIIDSLILICLMGGVRLTRRVYRELGWTESATTILIYGAGDAGEMVVRDMRNNPRFGKRPVGFIDDDARKGGSRIHGVPVLGTRTDLTSVIKQKQPDEVLIAMPAIDASGLRSVVRALEPFKVPIKTLPNIRDVLDDRIEVGQIRDLAFADLLPRNPVGFDQTRVAELIQGKSVMVTGAGGSIGSELCRQIVAMAPVRIVLFERHENTLYAVDQELSSIAGGVDIVGVVGDVSDRGSVIRAFEEYEPQIVFHAAAHKHVPLMEMRPNEAVKNNILGTRILAEESVRAGAERFILISSDKAADPSSVMGATKRVAELIVQNLAVDGGTRCSVVRFGNVLGSNGSVAPLFLDQIKKGGPVTVTHPDVRRYFMLIPEAVQLVLHAATLDDNGAIHVLDMGGEFKILDLARNLIRLAGYLPDEEIQIEFIGLRPGEKLSETLIGDGETLEATGREKTWRVCSNARRWASDELMIEVAGIEATAAQGTRADVIASLGRLVPTFATPVPQIVQIKGK